MLGSGGAGGDDGAGMGGMAVGAGLCALSTLSMALLGCLQV